MQASIIKELSKMQNLSTGLVQCLKKINSSQPLPFTLPNSKKIVSLLIQTICQSRNLLHYRHLDDRSTAQKCLVLIQDVLDKIVREHPQMLQFITNQFFAHLNTHSSCFISLAFYFLFAKHHQQHLHRVISLQALHKLLHKILINFEEEGQLAFLKNLSAQNVGDWKMAQTNLEDHLSKKFKPNKIKDTRQEVNVSLSKIPPLILPSSKSIQSSRQERTKGIGELRQLASAMGEGFIAVQLGCLLAHKRTQQVQQFSNNSDYQFKCLQKAETDRMLSSRLSLLQSSYSNTRSGFERQMDDTNRRFYRKSFVVLTNLINLCLQNVLSSKKYSVQEIKSFYLQYLDLAVIGFVDFSTSQSNNEHASTEYFSTIQLELLPVHTIMKIWGERISFITEKKHLKLLWNRNKKNCSYYYEDQLVQKVFKDEFLADVGAVRYQHLKLCSGNKVGRKEDVEQSDFILGEISLRINQIFSTCDMGNPRFYKYQINLLSLLGSYLQNSFSSTTQYLAIDMLFPVLLLIKRQIVELSHPLLENIDLGKPLQSSKRFGKREKHDSGKSIKLEQPLIVIHPELLSNYLVVISSLMSNQKHVQRLISTVLIKSTIFMQTLQRYVKYIFQKDMTYQIKQILKFYRNCIQIYNRRKLRNTESRSIKILFQQIQIYLYPKIGCISNKLQQKQYLISSNPQINQQTLKQHQFLHQLLDFVKEIYYYNYDELSENIFQESIATFYIKYSLINFIKLYSFITVNELVNLQVDGELATKESPHISYYPSVNTVYMIDFVRIMTSISIHRTFEISKKIKQYRVLEFFIREFQLQFQVRQNIQKYTRKASKIEEVPQKKKVHHSEGKSQGSKSSSLKLKAEKKKMKTSPVKEEKNDNKQKKKMVIPGLKLPTRSDRSQQKQPHGVLDSLIQEINEKPKKVGLQLNLQLTKLNINKGSESNQLAGSSQRDMIYSSERKIRKIYSNKTLHSEAILLVLSLLLNKGLLDPEYCDQFPITHGKINALYILHHHLNEEANRSVIPILAESVGRIKPYLAGQRLLKLLSTSFTDLSHYKNWKKISAGAYGVIYGCETNIEEPKQVAIKEMNFPKSIYQRCVLHDIFTEITCLQNFRLDDKVTTMYNYGVVSNAYIIVMKKYDCSLRDWVLQNQSILPQKLPDILKIFWDILHILLLLHQKCVTHYDIKADNILLQVQEGNGRVVKVVLGDFGQCRIYDQSKEELDMKSRGTECIKSPEMLTLALHLKKEADHYDRRKKIGTTRASDIWSLGCLLYQMLTGQFLYHRADWVHFYMQVTSTNEEILTKQNLKKLEKYTNYTALTEYLRSILIRDPQHRPEIKGVIQKFKDVFGDIKQNPPIIKSPLSIQKDLDVLVTKYIQEMKKEEDKVKTVSSNFLQVFNKDKMRRNNFMTSFNNSKSNKFMRIMQDIFFCQNVNLVEGGYEKMKQLKITHIVTTLQHPLLKKFNTLLLSFQGINLAHLAFRLAPKISDLLRQVLLLKGRLLFINDQTNYGTNLLIYTLSYWFRCSVYETWCLINTQILLFPTFTSDLLSLSSALRLLNDVEERVEELPKLQCICGSVTLILKEIVRSKRKSDLNCICKRKKLHQYPSMNVGPECPTTGCQNYLQFVKKRYSISWQSIKWASMSTNNLLSPIFSSGKLKETMRTQILLNASEPHQNMVDVGSCVKTCKVFTCKLCEMMIMATTESKDEILLVMNNMLRRIRQGIMIPNAQQSFAKKTPALRYYTLTKLHMTKGPQQ